MKKEERHQIKQDDLATALERLLVYSEKHLRPIIFIATTVVILLIAGLLLRGWVQNRAMQASLLVGEMMETYSLPIVQSLDDLQQARIGVESFTSEDERDERVLEQAEAILEEYGTSHAAPKALYYKGLSLANLRRYDDAVKALDRIVRDYSGDFLAPVARLHMARVQEAQGNPREALAHFQALADDTANGSLPTEEGLLGIGRCREALGEKDEALRIYQRLVDEFPNSEYMIDARKRIDELS